MLDTPEKDFARESENVGSVSEQSFVSLDPRLIPVEQISGSIFTAVFAVGVVIGLAILWFNLGLGIVWYSCLAAGLLFLSTLFYFAIFWPAKAYAAASWRLDEEGLEIRRGVIWKHQISIPLGRVQHADVSQGPLQRMYELGTLTVHTAGTSNASVNLEGLSHENALALRDRLVKQRKVGDVV